jgi:Protein kinase domain/Concanavalin A-like lectin/glucanases superfamily
MQPLSNGDPAQIGGYRLRGRLGIGGMGQVYLASTEAGRLVALKVMRPELSDDQEFRARFYREIQAARRVRGLYTAELVDADPDASPPWLATAYVPGPSLKQFVDENGPVPEAEAFRLIASIAEALHAIHAANVVHRDLKPSNVMLGPDGPRVIDFGIARALESATLTRAGAGVGTPGFMAPEQVLGQPVTPMIDVFALGALAAYAVLGKTPFGEGSADTVSERVLYQSPDLDGCPPRLRALIEPCLAKQPTDRPQVAQVLRFCLERAGAAPGQAPALADWPTEMGDGYQRLPPTMMAGVARQVPRHARPPAGPELSRQSPRQGDRRRHRLRVALVTAGALAIAAAATAYALPSRTPHPAGPCASSPSGSPGGGALADRWGLAGAQGTTVSDATGRHPATETNVSWKAGHGGAFFDGSDSQVNTQGPVLNTGAGASFTVAAWVCLTNAVQESATAVSQDNNEGSKISGFYLQYAGLANKSWSFSRSSVNSSAAVGIDALSAGPAALNTWIHLAGVYDASDHQQRLYVNGAPQGTATDKTPFAANGDLVIGRAEFGGDYVDWFPGYISDVEVFQQALDPAQVKSL